MKRHHLALVSGLLAIAAVLPAAAGVYKWVGKDGKVHYGDHPPTDEAVQAEEVNRSGVPLALQERLRGLDPAFIITRISGNLDIAYVCGEFNQEAYDREPRFPGALESARLGSVKSQQDRSYEDYQINSYQSQYNSQYGSRRDSHARRPEGKCPPRPAPTGDLKRRLYEIRFNAEAVSAYRTAPN